MKRGVEEKDGKGKAMMRKRKCGTSVDNEKEKLEKEEVVM